MNPCRYCEHAFQEGEIVVLTRSYWNQYPFYAHEDCKKDGERQEALDCQTIDADCNDCRHYKRGILEPKTVSKLNTPDGRTVDLIFQPNVFINGTCLKFNKPTLAFPNKWTGRECFEHRRAV